MITFLKKLQTSKILLVGVILITSCQSNKTDNRNITKDEMLQIVKTTDGQFSIGVLRKESTLLANIYSDSAQYVLPNRTIISGKYKIGKEWAGFVKMKENPVDIVFSINDVRGNREIIHETGQGYTLLADSTKWNFNYVNVWRLQNDESYKLDIDTYTPLD